MQTLKAHSDQMTQTESAGVQTDARLRLGDAVIDLLRDPAQCEADWQRLEIFDLNSLHQSRDWCSAWTETHGTSLVILRGKIGGRTAFILPLEVVVSKGIRLARFPGGGHNNINTGLFDPQIEMPSQEQIGAVRQRLAQALRPAADILLLDCLPLDWRGRRHPLADLATIESQNHAFQLPLLADFDATIDQLNAKTRRKKFRAQTRKLQAIGGFEHFIPSTPAEQHDLLDTFFRQKGARLKQLGLPDVFHDSEIRAFFHRLLDASKNGHNAALTVHSIRITGGEHAGHIAAVAGLSRKGDHVICQFSSIDESVCPEASPGELLFWHMIEKSWRDKAAIFDFGIGDQLYKRSWCTQETVQHNIYLPSSWKGALAKSALVLTTRAKTAIKQNQHLYSLLQRLRAARR